MVPGRAGLILIAGLWLAETYVHACGTCRPAVHAQIYNRDFPVHLITVVFPVAAILALGVAVLFWEPLVRRIRNVKEKVNGSGR